MELTVRVITGVLIALIIPILISLVYPKLENFAKKREADIQKGVKEREDAAKEEKSVAIDKKLKAFLLPLLIFVNLVGVLLVALPKFVTEYLEFNYVATLCVWWIPILFDDAVFCFMFLTKATYDDEKITVKKPFLKPAVYYFADITSFTKTGNLKVATTKGNFTLFNFFVGTQSLREFIAGKVGERETGSGYDL